MFTNKSTDFAANRHKWSTGQGHEAINFVGQEVKGQGHRRPKLRFGGLAAASFSTLSGQIGFCGLLLQ